MWTITDLLTHLRGGEDVSLPLTEEAYILALEAAAVVWVERQTGFHWRAKEDVTEVLPGTGRARLWLSDPPTGDPTSVLRHDVPGDAGKAETAWTLRARALQRTDGGTWDAAEYTVAYERGYDPGAEPPDIRNAVLQLVAWWYEQRTPVADIGGEELPMHLRTVLDQRSRIAL